MKMFASPRWTFRPEQRQVAQRFREAGLPPLIARILANRDVADVESARLFLDAPLSSMRDPFDIPDMDVAARRVARAIREGERVVIYGDYDVDGISATVILVELFEFLGARAGYYIPHRTEEGYGLNSEAIDKLAARGVQLLITVDNGVTAVAEISRARRLGIDVVVTDHHEPGDQLPDACAIVDPKRTDRPYDGTPYCGAGTAWKLAHATLRVMEVDSERGRQFLKSQMDLVALATVADVVPLTGENRVLARAGMGVLGQTRRLGVKALMRVAGVVAPRVTTSHIAFQLAPRINAVGRASSAMLAARLMLERGEEGANALALQLDEVNKNRRLSERSLLTLVNERLAEMGPEAQEPVLIVWGEGWEQGLIGLIASRQCDRLYRPAFVLSIDRGKGVAKGSARSITGFNLVEALAACSDTLVDFGGHAMAAGMRVAIDRLEDFRAAMRRYAETRLSRELLRPELIIDAELPLGELTTEAAESLDALEPFGDCNPRPLIACTNLTLADQPRVVGQRHLKMRLAQNGNAIPAIAFGMAEWDGRLLQHMERRKTIAVAGHLNVGEYQGRRYAELEIRDIQLEP